MIRWNIFSIKFCTNSQDVVIFAQYKLKDNRCHCDRLDGVFMTKIMRVVMGLALLGLQSWALADSKFNMTQGVTPISQDIYSIHMILLWTVTGIGVVTFGFLFYSVFKYRKSKGAKAAHFHDHPLLEWTWTIIPLIILVVLAIPATKVLLRMDDARDAEVTIKVTGYQWYWQYEYLDNGVAYFSKLATSQAQINNQELKGQWYLLEVDKPLVIPTNKKVRLLITSNDVIHSWWVPALGGKKDAVPGFIHEMWIEAQKPGVYRGQCAELCGAQHGFMPIVVEAKDEKSFNSWVAQAKKVSGAS